MLSLKIKRKNFQLKKNKKKLKNFLKNQLKNQLKKLLKNQLKNLLHDLFISKVLNIFLFYLFILSLKSLIIIFF
jgi:hypothetical protein